jgi:CDP-glycerol glycerophosphotransferase (TagB/SpsB family)
MKLLLSIPNTLSTRNLLRTDVLPRLKEAADRIVLVAPFADEPEFRREFVRDNVEACRMAPYAPGAYDRRLFSVLYNLYLAGPGPRSLQLFLQRWADNHPLVGPLRLGATKALLPLARPLAPTLERLLLASSDTSYYDQLLARERPDVAVFSRLFFCDEIPLMRAAVKAGVPTAGVVASWDNLTTKGPLLPRLDRLIVWNDLMKQEAVRFHGYGADDVAAAGAPHHDMLYRDRGTLADRREFCARLGLDPAKKLLTYAGEDPVIAPDAPIYIEQIHRAVEEGRFGRPVQLLVRPHPQDDPRRFDRVRNLRGIHFDLPGRPSAKYWMDMSRDDLKRLYETMWHSDVVANVTSTIVLDAAFFDTPTVCIGYGPSYPATHYNSPMRYFEMDHYRYIIDAGATRVVRSEDELIAWLTRYLDDPSQDAEGRRRIVRDIAQFDDGRSAERTARSIIDAARRAPRVVEERSTAGIAAPGRAI